MKSKRIVFTLISIWILMFFAEVPAKASEAIGAEDYGPDIYAESYCVIDGASGEILMSQHKDDRHFPASTTKVMTALLVLENVEDLSQTLTFTPSAIHIDPSSSTLEPKASIGETMTVKDALYGMLLKSANECGAMLGEFVAGSEAAFADMMNARAAEIGCTNTHFMNAYGIHNDNHYTSAYDLCLILREAMKNPRYRELNGTKEYTIPATNMNSARTFPIGHGMISGTVVCDAVPAEDIIGGKTGSTPQAGRTLVTAADHDGLYTISALMKSNTDHFYQDEIVLLEYTYGMHDGTLWPYSWVPTNDTVTASGGVRARYSPSLMSAVYDNIPDGTVLQREAVYMNWSRVNYNGETLYVWSDYLMSSEPEKIPETTAYVFVPTETAAETLAAEHETEAASEEGTMQTVTEDTETETIASSLTAAPEGYLGEDETFGKEVPVLLIAAVVFGVGFLICLLAWLFFVLPNKRKKNKRIHRQQNKNMLF